MTYPTTPFERTVDNAIAEENRRAAESLCRPCAGTGTLYIKLKGRGHRREVCSACNGSGERGASR